MPGQTSCLLCTAGHNDNHRSSLSQYTYPTNSHFFFCPLRPLHVTTTRQRDAPLACLRRMSPISRIHQHRGGRPRWQKGVLVGLSTGLTIVYVIFVVLSGRYALFQLTSEGDREHHKISLLSQAQSQQGTNAPQPQPAAQAPAAKPRCDPKPSADPEHALQPLLSAPALEAGVHSIIPIEKGTLECTDSPPRQRGEDGSIVYWRKWTEETMWSSPFKPKGDGDRSM